MTQPATGTTYDGAGFSDLDSRFLERGKLVQALVRDARGAATDISPHNPDGSLRWSPFAEDNTWRDDLLITRRVNGAWVNAATPNQKFHITGAFKEGDGPGSKPSIRKDDFMIVQSNFPFDSDLVEEGEPFSFTPVETGKPLIRRLRNNLPLTSQSGDNLVEDPGTLNAGWSRPLDGENIGRQVLLVRELRKDGLPIYVVDGYALAKLDDIGNSKKDKRDSEASELTYNPLPDGYFMAMVDGVYRPILRHTWVGGAGWTALGGTPVVSATAPTATPGGAGEVTLAFAEPTGTGDPWEYKGQFSTDGGTTWGSEIEPSDVTVNSGTVTLEFTGVAAGSKMFRAKVTGSNGATALTPASTAVTVTS